MACDWAVQNANNVIGMLLFLTTEIVQPFMRKELADRIAAMLNDWLLHLVGPRSQASHATDDMHHASDYVQHATDDTATDMALDDCQQTWHRRMVRLLPLGIRTAPRAAP
jgi:hypothetical protein